MAIDYVHIIIKKTAKVKPTWIVCIVWHTQVTDFLTVVLPGEFRRGTANRLGGVLAETYRSSGYKTKLTTAGR